MAANVVESVDRFGTAPDHDHAFTRDFAQKVVAVARNGIGASGADPTAKVEAVDLSPKNLRIRVIAGR